MRSVRLKAGRRVGQCLVLPLEAKPVTGADVGVTDKPGKIAVQLRGQLSGQTALDLDYDALARGRPDAEMHAAGGLHLGADGQPHLHGTIGKQQRTHPSIVM
jgi:hypothetical protein